MLLKLVTYKKDGTRQDDYIPLKSNFSVTYPNLAGSFGESTFGVDEVKPQSDTAAVIHWANCDNNSICIQKDQGAYIISEDGTTNTVINKLEELVVWCKRHGTSNWIKGLAIFTPENMRIERKTRNSHEWVDLKDGIDPNSSYDITDQDNKVIWMIHNKGTSKTWRPCSQMEYQMNRDNPDFGFKHCAPGEDPNQVKQEWLK